MKGGSGQPEPQAQQEREACSKRWHAPSTAEVKGRLGGGHAQVTDSPAQIVANPPPTEGVCSDPKRSNGVGEVGIGSIPVKAGCKALASRTQD